MHNQYCFRKILQTERILNSSVYRWNADKCHKLNENNAADEQHISKSIEFILLRS